MCSHCLERCAQALVLAATLIAAVPQVSARELRVCADPDNLPYSNAAGEGFENRIATVLAGELHADLRYTWLPQWRGFVRKTIGAGSCDVVIGVPEGYGPVLTTRPYYRSRYVMVYRADRESAYTSLDDPRLRIRRVAVQLPGNDMAATPAGEALARRGIVANVVGYTPFGDGPAARRIIDDVAARRVDVALVWGPQAGYFARRSGAPLALVPIHDVSSPVPFEFAIAIGVKRGDTALRDALDRALDAAQPRIDAILAQFGVPRSDEPIDARAALAALIEAHSSLRDVVELPMP